jgi:hypothetical protein
MKDKLILLVAIFVSLLFLFSKCHIDVWGGDGELLVDEVTLETGPHKETGKYRVQCVILNGYRKTCGDILADYIIINTDSLYKIGDTIYIGK